MCGCVNEADTYPDCCGDYEECSPDECHPENCDPPCTASCAGKTYCYDVGCNEDGYRGSICEYLTGPKCTCPTETEQLFINSGLGGCRWRQ